MTNKKKKIKDLNSLSELVYSTNPDFIQDMQIEEKSEATDPNTQNLRIWTEKKHRGGKIVTIIRDFEGSEKELNELGKKLKSQCGTGGSAKDREIILQGNIADKVLKILNSWGYKAKRAGG